MRPLIEPAASWARSGVTAPARAMTAAATRRNDGCSDTADPPCRSDAPGLQRRRLRFLREQLVLELNTEILERRFRGMQREARVERFLFDLGVAEFKDDGVGFDLGAGPENDPFHSPIGSRREPPGIFRYQRAEAAMLADHRAAFDGIGKNRGALDGRSGRLHSRERY